MRPSDQDVEERRQDEDDGEPSVKEAPGADDPSQLMVADEKLSLATQTSDEDVENPPFLT